MNKPKARQVAVWVTAMRRGVPVIFCRGYNNGMGSIQHRPRNPAASVSVGAVRRA